MSNPNHKTEGNGIAGQNGISVLHHQRKSLQKPKEKDKKV